MPAVPANRRRTRHARSATRPAPAACAPRDPASGARRAGGTAAACRSRRVAGRTRGAACSRNTRGSPSARPARAAAGISSRPSSSASPRSGSNSSFIRSTPLMSRPSARRRKRLLVLGRTSRDCASSRRAEPFSPHPAALASQPATRDTARNAQRRLLHPVAARGGSKPSLRQHPEVGQRRDGAVGEHRRGPGVVRHPSGLARCRALELATATVRLVNVTAFAVLLPVTFIDLRLALQQVRRADRALARLRRGRGRRRWSGACCASRSTRPC